MACLISGRAVAHRCHRLPIIQVSTMREPYLEVTFRHGRPLAAYLYLPRSPGDHSRRTVKASGGLLIDYTDSGKPIGIEITAPAAVTVGDLNAVLKGLNASPLTEKDIVPLKAA